MNSMVYRHRFPCFGQAKNSLSLFLVVCKNVPISGKVVALLHVWAESIDGKKAYVGLLDVVRETSPPDELMLSLSALMLLQSMREGAGTGKDPPEHVSLFDVHRRFTGEETSSSDGAIVREMIPSFFRTVGQFLPTNDKLPYVRFYVPCSRRCRYAGAEPS